jgi:hypothetical protein
VAGRAWFFASARGLWCTTPVDDRAPVVGLVARIDFFFPVLSSSRLMDNINARPLQFEDGLLAGGHRQGDDVRECMEASRMASISSAIWSKVRRCASGHALAAY